ncbi:MAG: hypothetical protein CO186_08320 [Zetaproteobacteria bacterium CG_4_9_14_3_um_filter_49_83]|nr:MAG: hypothetical protein AUJ56_00990 [Zetaproteobacteria bacterium CG1_02_49_23]PIQ30308.1 MAG: hypothetical protein COW62_12905 [Zetaproteobacteria bacterium CG17_big_fil_post_rev_8_21_14_2_50_50_13]PIV29561.1 MAG: hypothetical protein COS35_11350 [Zetaproteobacteria bacterium CG02_land_8_20_14_3_00_50_9]PIY55236.1 MAG: hypothetical protein COZ00_10510 [Zetaproteobacteria bacterium CG_4_10_14_0_8_um_filter_49_80]PJA34971.1 MAG: hypothetical protein CO186_08320 [Zetaproteobacteria bacterium
MNIYEKPLELLSHDEWEQLCDGCALCCMHKFEDEDTGELLLTTVACRLLDTSTCRCRQYEDRMESVPSCLQIRHFTKDQYRWLPETCAYRLRFESKPLLPWHPLLSGDKESVHEAFISLRDQCVSEIEVDEDDIPSFIIDDDL